MTLTDFRADLHCHSTCSDGTLSPKELLQLAKERGLQGLSITDHDTIESYPEVFSLAKELEIAMIPGVEFSSVHQGESVHILGYSFALDHPSILNLCERHRTRRRERNQMILDLLEQNEMPLELSFEGRPKGRPHIAEAMVEQGYVANVQEAFRKWIGDKMPCYAKGDTVSSEETVRVIHEAGGVAVLAHPHLIPRNWLIPPLLQLPLDGIECYYARFGMKEHQRWLNLATEKKLLISGGSDFHGSIKPHIPLGCSWAPEATFRYLLAKHHKTNPGL